MSISRSLAAIGVTALAFALVGSITRAQAPAAAPVSREQLLEAHMKDEKSGSADAGRPVFEKLCAGCHRFGAIGKSARFRFGSGAYHWDIGCLAPGSWRQPMGCPR